MRERPFFHTTRNTLMELANGLQAVVDEAPPDQGALTCALLLGLVKSELTQRKVLCDTATTPSS